MSSRNFLCSFCLNNRSFNKFSDYFRHITLYHASEPHFRLICNLSDSCGRLYKTFISYKAHIHRHHKYLLDLLFQEQEDNVINGVENFLIDQSDASATNHTIIDDNIQDLIYNDSDIGGDDNSQTFASTSNFFHADEKITFMTVQKQYTLFLLQLREQHMLPQGVIRSITTSIVNFLDMTIDLLDEKAKEENINEQPSSTTMISTNSIRKTIKQIEESIILSTKNEYQFIQSCKNFFDYTPPIEHLISLKDEKKEYSYHISIKDSLKKILEKNEMVPLLISNIENQDKLMHVDSDLMFSFRHGIRGNKINKNSFLIQLYIDGIGVTNPIGPRKGHHKITTVYFLLEDIPDIFRSTLQCINLAAICYTKYLNNNEKLKKFYAPIVNDLNELQSTGLRINTCNSQIYFTFTTIAADNLAAHEVAGFQETFSSGHFCRRCLISYENRLVSLADIDFIPRVNVKHQYYLQLKSKHLRRKSIFGVVGPSPFDEVINFDPTKFFPGDLMHDFFEGNY
ncbi:unnamed protein product [Rotaria sp. Silwood1]|nr:unnamed protein product [Rotaria sp. Silwood1]